MAARGPGGPRSQESHSASAFSPQQQQDPFASSNALPQQPRGYYDGEAESQDYRGTRDTYASDSSQGPHDGDRYYDNDPYSQWSTADCNYWTDLTSFSTQTNLTMNQMAMPTATSMHHRVNRSALLAWASRSRQHPRSRSTLARQALKRLIQHGAQTARSLSRRKRLKISSWISPRNLASSENPCAIWYVVASMCYDPNSYR